MMQHFHHTTSRHDQYGFTLIEVLTAVAILGLAVFILMDAHYGAMSLHIEMDEAAAEAHLMENLLAIAEMGVLNGDMSGSGDFGARYLDYTWSYDAYESGAYDEVLLFTVTATLNHPNRARSMEFLVYNTGIEGGF